MRGIAAVTMAILFPVAGGAGAIDSPIAEDTPVAEAVPKPVVAETTGKKEFKPPNGFQTKTRSGETLYCKKDSAIGTRFSTEKCYNEAQLREHMEILEHEMRNLEQMRTYCSDPSRCQSE